MAKLFLVRTNSKATHVPKNDYGGLIGCAKEWPEKYRIKVFLHALNNWPVFMARYKHTVALAYEATKKPDDPDYEDLHPKKRVRFYRFPNIHILRKGHAEALEIYIDHLQEAGKGEAMSVSLSPVDIVNGI